MPLTLSQEMDVFNHLNDSILLLDKSSSVIYVNPAFERLFRYTSKDIVGRSAFELLPEIIIEEDSSRGFEQLINVLERQSSEPGSKQFELVSKNGKRITLLKSLGILNYQELYIEKKNWEVR